jgi:hypothetical protein
MSMTEGQRQLFYIRGELVALRIGSDQQLPIDVPPLSCDPVARSGDTGGMAT